LFAKSVIGLFALTRNAAPAGATFFDGDVAQQLN
jgi:hypothetical protein